MPLCTAGLALRISNQRERLGNESRVIPAQSWKLIHGQVAMSATSAPRPRHTRLYNNTKSMHNPRLVNFNIVGH